jgi:hypothetical protein
MTEPDQTLTQVMQMIAPLRERLLDREIHPARMAVWLARTIPPQYHVEMLAAMANSEGGLFGVEPHDSEAAILLRAAMLTDEEKEEYRRRRG